VAVNAGPTALLQQTTGEYSLARSIAFSQRKYNQGAAFVPSLGAPVTMSAGIDSTAASAAALSEEVACRGPPQPAMVAIEISPHTPNATSHPVFIGRGP
jgi:hypothetical protein